MSPGSTEVMELLQDPAATAGQKIQVMEPWTKDLGWPFTKFKPTKYTCRFKLWALPNRFPGWLENMRLIMESIMELRRNFQKSSAVDWSKYHGYIPQNHALRSNVSQLRRCCAICWTFFRGGGKGGGFKMRPWRWLVWNALTNIVLRESTWDCWYVDWIKGLYCKHVAYIMLHYISYEKLELHSWCFQHLNLQCLILVWWLTCGPKDP